VGCRNPLNPFDTRDFYVEHADLGRLRHLQAVELADYSDTAPVSLEEAASAMMVDDWRPMPLDARDEKISLPLAEVRAAALANNLDLRVALFDPSIAEIGVDEEEAKFEWTLLASARRSKVDQPTSSELTGASSEFDSFNVGLGVPLRTGGTIEVNLPVDRTKTDNPFSTLNPAYAADVSFSITQPLLRGAGIRPNTHSIRVAKYQRDITTALTKLEAIRILANADRSYWRLYAAHKALEVAYQQYDLAVEQLERAERRFEAEVVPRLEITRAESGVASRLENIIVAEQQLLEVQRELKRIMNRDDLPVGEETLLMIATDPNPVSLDLDPVTLADFAVENRMEMLEQELRLAIDASTIDFEKNQALPLVVVDYTYNVNGLGGNPGNAFDVLGDKRFEDHTFGIRVEVPLGNEAAESRVERAILTRIQRLSTRAQRELAIRQEVYNVTDRLRADWQRILAARHAVILATEVLRGEERQFNVGERTSTDVLDAATELANAQLTELRALVDYQIDQIDLAFATGTLLGMGQIAWEPLTIEDAGDMGE